MKSKKGFTLIELLVVIAIIAMLLAIITPALNKAKQKAKEVICKIHQRGIGLGMRLYIDENDGKVFRTLRNRYMWYVPSGPNMGQEISPTDTSAYWGVAYRDYVESTKVYGCPSFQRPIDSLYSDMPPELLKEAAFAINHHIASSRFPKITDIKSPSFFIVCHDHQEPKIENGSRDHFHNDDSTAVNAKNVTQYREDSSNTLRKTLYRNLYRHSTRFSDPWKTGGKANILWLDGHVSALAESWGHDVRVRWYSGQ